MKVLVIATSLRATSIGGGDSFLIDLANGIAEQMECSVTMFIGSGAHERLKDLLDPAITFTIVRQHKGSLRVISDFLLTRGRAHRSGADVMIYPHEWKPPTRIATLLVVQNVLWLHPATRRGAGLRGTLLRQLTHFTGRRAQTIVAVSDSARDLWLAATGASPHSVEVIPEGLHVQPEAVIAQPLHSSIVAITGAAEYKGLAVLSEAARIIRQSMPDFCLDVVGVTREPEDGMLCHGFVDRAHLLGMMRSARLVLFPSAVESFGLPAFEATALGVNCAVRAGTPMSDWLGDRVLTFDGSAAGLAQLITEALEGTLPPATPVTDFLWPNVASRWLRICHRAAGEAT